MITWKKINLRKRIFFIIFFVSVLSLIILVSGTFFILKKYKKPSRLPLNSIYFPISSDSRTGATSSAITSDWGIHECYFDKFSIRLPQNTHMQQGDENDRFFIQPYDFKDSQIPTVQGYRIEVTKFPQKPKTVKEFMAAMQGAPEPNLIDKQEEITINGIPVLKRTFKENSSEVSWEIYKQYYFHSQNLGVLFSGRGFNRQLLDQIASTFNFSSPASISNYRKQVVSSDWKTFTNSEHHFSIEYPINWFIDKEGKTITNYNPSDWRKVDLSLEGDYIIVSFHGITGTKESNQTLEEFIKQRNAKPEYYIERVVYTSVKTTSLPAMIVDYCGYGGPARQVFLAKGNDIYLISFSGGYNNIYKEEADRILASFKLE